MMNQRDDRGIQAYGPSKEEDVRQADERLGRALKKRNLQLAVTSMVGGVIVLLTRMVIPVTEPPDDLLILIRSFLLVVGIILVAIGPVGAFFTWAYSNREPDEVEQAEADLLRAISRRE